MEVREYRRVAWDDVKISDYVSVCLSWQLDITYKHIWTLPRYNFQFALEIEIQTMSFIFWLDERGPVMCDVNILE